MSNKITPTDELNIIAWRAMGQSYDELRKSTGHGNTVISRTLQPDNLCQHVICLIIQDNYHLQDARFYKKYLKIALAVWALSIIASYVLSFIL